MPNLANITVKKNDGTTDIVYTGLQPAGGDGSKTLYRQEDLTLPYGQRPILQTWAVENGNKTARRVEASFKMPFVYTDTTTGLKKSTDLIPFSLSGTFPKSIPSSVIDEAVSQFFNLLNSAQVKDQFKTGFASN